MTRLESLRSGHTHAALRGLLERRFSVAPQHTVAAVIGEGVLTFDFAVPCEVFGLDRSDIVAPWYRFIVCSADPPPIRSSTGFVIDGVLGLDALREADTVVIPGWRDADVEPSAELVQSLLAAHARGARVMSICIGTFVLAATGLLDGRRATTHWMYADRLAKRFPSVQVDPTVLYVDDGDILTSAGTAAGIDLCLHVVRRDYGAEVANRVARRIVMPPHREGGQAQYVDQPVAPAAGTDLLRAACEWALAHLGEPIGVEDLAQRAAMSPRTLTRRFSETLGLPPHEWLLRQRLHLAQRLLEMSDEPLEVVATRAGFGSAVSLRHHFRQRLDVSPRAYRRTFRARAQGV